MPIVLECLNTYDFEGFNQEKVWSNISEDTLTPFYFNKYVVDEDFLMNFLFNTHFAIYKYIEAKRWFSEAHDIVNIDFK
jgi:hypothetical protein